MSRFRLVPVALVVLAAACGQRSELRVTNNLGSYDITAVYAFPDSSLKRGQNLLEGRIQPGEVVTFEMARGTYDVIVVDEDDDSYDYPGLPLDENGHDLLVKLEDFNMGHVHSGDGTLPITIENGLGSITIYFAYASLTTSGWGEDMLRTTVLVPGEELTIWVMPGNWNVRLEDEYGEAYVLTGIELGGGTDGYSHVLTMADREI